MLEIKDFEIAKMPEELKGLTSDILWNLHDIVTKFGVLDVKFQQVGMSMELHDGEKVIISAFIEERPQFKIGKHPLADDVLEILLENNNIIVWEKGLSLETVKKFIAELDALAWKKGWIDRINGRRIKMISLLKNFGEYKYKVSEVFTDKYDSIPVYPESRRRKKLSICSTNRISSWYIKIRFLAR